MRCRDGEEGRNGVVRAATGAGSVHWCACARQVRRGGVPCAAISSGWRARAFSVAYVSQEEFGDVPYGSTGLRRWWSAELHAAGPRCRRSSPRSAPRPAGVGEQGGRPWEGPNGLPRGAAAPPRQVVSLLDALCLWELLFLLSLSSTSCELLRLGCPRLSGLRRRRRSTGSPASVSAFRGS